MLLPEVLSTYADSGNAVVLAQRLRWRGLRARVVTCKADASPPLTCDIYLLGGGEDAAQQFAAGWLRDHPALCTSLRDKALTLAVCAGLQILGRSVRDSGGREHPGAGVLEVTTSPRRRRAVGDIVTSCLIPDVGRLRGFENHQGATLLGPGVLPLGEVLTGVGNGEQRRLGSRRLAMEGVLTDRVVGTYLHGPVLAKNPALADHLLRRVTGTALAPLRLQDEEPLDAARVRQGHHTGLPKLFGITRTSNQSSSRKGDCP